MAFARLRKYTKENGSFLRVITSLNAAFLVSALGDRLWAFSMGIIMHRLGGMTWVALHQLAEAAFKLILATKVGSLLDEANRNKGIQIVLFANNVCITISAFSFYFMFANYVSPDTISYKVVLITAIVFGGLSRVASEAQKTAFMKDWIVVLIGKSKATRLSTQNGIMNMIDQSAAFLSPFIAGALLDNFTGATCCIVIIIWNLCSWAVEAAVLMWVYVVTPELSFEKESEEGEDGERSSPFHKYFRQKAFRAMFGLALLYMTVLGFDNLAISYGASQGMSATQLATFRSVGSLLGFLGNVAYTFSERWIGVLLTGLIGLTIQNIFINFCSTSVFLPGNPFNISGYVSTINTETWVDDITSHIYGSDNATTTEVSLLHFNQLPIAITVFFFGITAARFGLWLADPAIMQIMQETIPENERYSVNAVQNVFCEFFSILKDVLVILFPTTTTFGALILLSCCFVFAGYVFYISYFVSNFRCSDRTKSVAEQEMKTIRTTSKSSGPENERLIASNLVDRALNTA